jgi:hypothetical protein
MGQGVSPSAYQQSVIYLRLEVGSELLNEIPENHLKYHPGMAQTSCQRSVPLRLTHQLLTESWVKAKEKYPKFQKWQNADQRENIPQKL